MPDSFSVREDFVGRAYPIIKAVAGSGQVVTIGSKQ
jgi:hypothetical protein